jgi:integrase
MLNATTFLLGDLAQRFLTSKKNDCDLGHLSKRTYADYCRAVTMFTSTFGKDRDVAGLTPADFERLYQRLASQHGILTLAREVTMIRTACKYFADYCEAPPVRTGPKFRPPTQLAKRRERNRIRELHGTRLFTPVELRSLLNNANRFMKAMILLGINCGFGNTDCAELPRTAIDLDKQWLDFPRRKTEVRRHIPLWEETKRALHIAMLCRHKPNLAEDGNLVFISCYGNRMIRAELKSDDILVITDSVSQAFRTLLKCLSLYRPGLSFYTLRHTFETIAGECGDQVAVDAIMGHVDSSMAQTYRERITDDRLRSVVQHVHNWLYQETQT